MTEYVGMSEEGKDKPKQEMQKPDCLDSFDRSLVKLRSSKSKFGKSLSHQENLVDKQT